MKCIVEGSDEGRDQLIPVAHRRFALGSRTMLFMHVPLQGHCVIVPGL